MEVESRQLRFWGLIGDSSSISFEEESEKETIQIEDSSRKKEIKNDDITTNTLLSIINKLEHNETFTKKLDKNKFPEDVLIDPIIHTRPKREYRLLKIGTIEKGTPDSKKPEYYIDNRDV